MLGAARQPVVFDVVATTPSPAALLTLPSPHLAGLPHDAAASQALAHAIIARSLLVLADQLAGGSATEQDKEAMAARAEARLGLAQAP